MKHYWYALGAVGILVVAVLLLQQPSAPPPYTGIISAGGTAIGDAASDFRLETTTGEVLQLSQFRGKKAVLVNFWATWCPFCLDEFRAFQAAYQQHRDQLEILAINLQEDDVQKMERFAAELGTTFPLLLDPAAEVKEAYQVFTQPVSYFVDINGKIIDKKFGPLTEEEIAEKLSRLLAVEISPETAAQPQVQMTTDGVKYTVHPDKLRSGGPPKDGIPSIDNPQFVPVTNADFLEDDDLVLGLDFHGVQRAYPLRILVWHELVNDIVDGKGVLITYCPLCGTGIAYDPTIAGERTEFGVSGKLYNSDLVMYDRKTDTYWDQITGTAIVGELSGMRLQRIPLDTLRWKDWRERHPATEVLSTETGFSRNYQRSPYGDYDTSAEIYFPVEYQDNRLHPKAVIYGIELNSQFAAYPGERLAELGAITDTVGGVDIRIAYSQGVVTAETLSGEQLIPVRSFWFAWAAFHPDTRLYE